MSITQPDGHYHYDPDQHPDEPAAPEVRSISLNCRVTPSMRAEVDEAAEWAQMRMGDWLRSVVGYALEEYRDQRRREEDPSYHPDDEDVVVEAAPEPTRVAAVESSIEYQQRVRDAVGVAREAATARPVAPIQPSSAPKKARRFPDPKDCPHLPSKRRPGGVCSDCGGKVGRYINGGVRGLGVR
jgi:hypothetical protein